MQQQMTQLQQFHMSHRHTADVLQECTWLAGLSGDNPNPLTWDEVKALAKAGKPYSWAFDMIVAGHERMTEVDRQLWEAAQENRSRRHADA